MMTSETAVTRRVLSPRECWQIAGCCKNTFKKELRPHLAVVQITRRKVGHWSDELYALLEARTER